MYDTKDVIDTYILIEIVARTFDCEISLLGYSVLHFYTHILLQTLQEEHL